MNRLWIIALIFAGCAQAMSDDGWQPIKPADLHRKPSSTTEPAAAPKQSISDFIDEHVIQKANVEVQAHINFRVEPGSKVAVTSEPIAPARESARPPAAPAPALANPSGAAPAELGK